MGLSANPSIFRKTGIDDKEKVRDALTKNTGSHVLARVSGASHEYLGGELYYKSIRHKTYELIDSDGNPRRFKVDDLLHMIVVSSQLL